MNNKVLVGFGVVGLLIAFNSQAENSNFDIKSLFENKECQDRELFSNNERNANGHWLTGISKTSGVLNCKAKEVELNITVGTLGSIQTEEHIEVIKKNLYDDAKRCSKGLGELYLKSHTEIIKQPYFKNNPNNLDSLDLKYKLYFVQDLRSDERPKLISEVIAPKECKSIWVKP
jgi:hypothetical protein